MKQYSAYLLDLDGTMYKGDDIIDGAVEFIDYLSNRNIPYLFVTNNSSKEPIEVAERLNRLGIKATADDIITSAVATADYISNEQQDATVYMVGGNGLKTALSNKGLQLKDDEFVDYVVIGLDEAITYEKLGTATLGVRNGAKFISTNKDVSIPKERGFMPGNGALTSVVSVSTGQEPVFIGKPEPVIMNMALSVLDLPKDEVAMVGDLYDTDILSGINVNIDTIHVQTGVTSLEEIEQKEQPPTYSFKDLNEVIVELER
jgi:4-nitrophenyl phosphatase